MDNRFWVGVGALAVWASLGLGRAHAYEIGDFMCFNLQTVPGDAVNWGLACWNDDGDVYAGMNFFFRESGGFDVDLYVVNGQLPGAEDCDGQVTCQAYYGPNSMIRQEGRYSDHVDAQPTSAALMCSCQQPWGPP